MALKSRKGLQLADMLDLCTARWLFLHMALVATLYINITVPMCHPSPLLPYVQCGYVHFPHGDRSRGGLSWKKSL